jgi:hypothetical protein
LCINNIDTVEVEGGSVNRCFKTPVIIANTGYRKGLSRKLSYGKIAALFLHINIPMSRGDRPASPPNLSASRFSRNFSDLGEGLYYPPYRIILYLSCAVGFLPATGTGFFSGFGGALLSY